MHLPNPSARLPSHLVRQAHEEHARHQAGRLQHLQQTKGSWVGSSNSSSSNKKMKQAAGSKGCTHKQSIVQPTLPAAIHIENCMHQLASQSARSVATAVITRRSPIIHSNLHLHANTRTCVRLMADS
jgi:hypothetical protein